MISFHSSSLRLISLFLVWLSVLAFACAPGHPGLDDFYVFYDSAGLVSSGQLYKVVEHGGRFLPFLRVPAYAWMLRPFSLLPYAEARLCWMACIVLAFALFVALWPTERRMGMVVAFTASVPLMYALQTGQDIAFVLLIAALAVRVADKGKDFAAGLLVSLLAIKLTFLIPVGLVFAARSRRSLAGVALGLTAFFLLSIPGTGIDWPLQYLATLRLPGLDPVPTALPSVRNVASLFPSVGGFLVAGCLVGGYSLIWRMASVFRVADAVAVAMAIGVVTAPHSLTYDCVLFVPLFLRVYSIRRWAACVAVFCLSPLPYLLITSSVMMVRVWVSLLLIAAVGACSVLLYRDCFLRFGFAGRFLTATDGNVYRT